MFYAEKANSDKRNFFIDFAHIALLSEPQEMKDQGIILSLPSNPLVLAHPKELKPKVYDNQMTTAYPIAQITGCWSWGRKENPLPIGPFSSLQSRLPGAWQLRGKLRSLRSQPFLHQPCKHPRRSPVGLLHQKKMGNLRDSTLTTKGNVTWDRVVVLCCFHVLYQVNLMFGMEKINHAPPKHSKVFYPKPATSNGTWPLAW